MKNFFRKETAMTLSEIMLVFLIIGIVASITSVGINSMTTKTKNKYLTTSAFLILKKSVANIIADDDDGTLPTTGSSFCNLLTQYMNVIGLPSCTSTAGTVTAGTSINSKTPNFKLANGMKFYGVGDDISSGFFYVYIDVDGDSRKGIVDDDVIRFSISQTGIVAPFYNSIGANNTDYISAIIKGNDSKDDGSGNISATKGGAIVAIGGKTLFTYKQAACYSGFFSGAYCTSGTSIGATSACTDGTYNSCWPEIVMPKGLRDSN